jgi:CHASE2 domain-containing sensor protein
MSTLNSCQSGEPTKEKKPAALQKKTEPNVQRPDKKKSKHIVLVNIGELGRKGIAKQIRNLRKYNPKVIALDVVFDRDKGPSDTILKNAFDEVEQLVLATKVYENSRSKPYLFQKDTGNHPKFISYADIGHVDLIEKSNIATAIYPQVLVRTDTIPAFGWVVASKYKEGLPKPKGLQPTKIHYSGNIDHYDVISAEDVLEDDVDELKKIEGKIVMMGFLGSDLSGMEDIDKYSSPFNTNLNVKDDPDMFDTIIQANIVEMFVKGRE